MASKAKLSGSVRAFDRTPQTVPPEVIHDGDPGDPLDLGPDGLPSQPAESLGCETYPSPDFLQDADCSP